MICFKAPGNQKLHQSPFLLVRRKHPRGHRGWLKNMALSVPKSWKTRSSPCWTGFVLGGHSGHPVAGREKDPSHTSSVAHDLMRRDDHKPLPMDRHLLHPKNQRQSPQPTSIPSAPGVKVPKGFVTRGIPHPECHRFSPQLFTRTPKFSPYAGTYGIILSHQEHNGLWEERK